MSDCSTQAMEPKQPRTCGNCYRYYNVRPIMRQGLCPLDELDEDGCAPIHNEDDVACGRWLEIEMPLEQRYEQLAQVAREMSTYIGSFTLLLDHKHNDRDAARENARRFMEFDEQINECGVSMYD